MDRLIERTEDLNYIIDVTRRPRLPEVDASFEDFLAVVVRAEVARLDRAQGRRPAPSLR